jgi:hypothetical protein
MDGNRRLYEDLVTANREARQASQWNDLPLTAPLAPSAPHNGTETSREAAESVVDTAEADRWRVLRFVASRGDYGATRQEIEAALSIGGDSVRPRVWECVEVEQVRRHFGVNEPLLTAPGHKRKTASGRSAFVLLATLAGIRMVTRAGYADAA